MMLNKPLHSIEHADILKLVSERYSERKTIEYKGDRYGTGPEPNAELCKDVSSFANTHGGDLIIGVEEEESFPVAADGYVPKPDIDKEILRMQDVLNSGLRPRLVLDFHPIRLGDGKFIVVIRIPESAVSPHRVVKGGQQAGFWKRSTNGCNEMDVEELRQAFAFSSSAYEQMKRFRDVRVDSGRPIPLIPYTGTLLLHLMPLSAFRNREPIDVAKLPNRNHLFAPLDSQGAYRSRLNFDGLLTYSQQAKQQNAFACVQLFRSGIVESAVSEIIKTHIPNRRLLNTYYYEQHMPTHVTDLLANLEAIGVQPPFYGFVSLLGLDSVSAPAHSGYEPEPVTAHYLKFPEFVIEDIRTPPISYLKPTFDHIWNTWDVPQTPHYKNGQFQWR